jgi:hypothetical protein
MAVIDINIHSATQIFGNNFEAGDKVTFSDLNEDQIIDQVAINGQPSKLFIGNNLLDVFNKESKSLLSGSNKLLTVKYKKYNVTINTPTENYLKALCGLPLANPIVNPDLCNPYSLQTVIYQSVDQITHSNPNTNLSELSIRVGPIGPKEEDLDSNMMPNNRLVITLKSPMFGNKEPTINDLNNFLSKEGLEIVDYDTSKDPSLLTVKTKTPIKPGYPSAITKKYPDLIFMANH